MWHHSASYSVFSVGFAASVAWRGHKKKSLSSSGAVAAWIIGTLHLLAGPQFGLTLIVFFFSSSKLTKLKEDVKAKLEDEFRSGGQRTATQVVPKGTNGGVSSLGTFCGVAGSILMGLTFWLSSLLTLLKGATMPAVPCIIIALFGGAVGNFIDSLLGATLQYSGYSRTKHCVVTAPGPSIDRICGQSLLSNSQMAYINGEDVDPQRRQVVELQPH
ncbi:MAG: transmembrane 19-like [Trebouxia sp. A1-2]|nr:MAG: transmembrane 19-like [Trebouxia sp. A1-2]